MTSIELIRYLDRRIRSLFPQKQGAVFALPTHLAQGMDGARYQVTFDPSVASLPLTFAFQKLTEGTTYRDPSIDELWKGVSQLKVRGGYHYMRSGMSWSAQLENYLGAANLHEYNVHAVDVEGYGNTYSDTFFADARRVIDGIRLARQQKVLLYTNSSTYTLFAAAIRRQYSDAQMWLDSLDLWVAYPSTTLSEPPLPTGRETAIRPWTFWQDNWNCTGCGCTVASDHNFFNGVVSDLYAWAGVDDATPPPPDSGGTMRYEATAKGNGTRLRPDHNVNSTYISSWNEGTVFAGNELYEAPDNNTPNQAKGDLWLKVETINGQVPAVSGWVAIKHMGIVICNLKDNGAPSETISAVRFTGEVVFDFTDGRQEVWHVTDMPFTKGPA